MHSWNWAGMYVYWDQLLEMWSYYCPLWWQCREVSNVYLWSDLHVSMLGRVYCGKYMNALRIRIDKLSS